MPSLKDAFGFNQLLHGAVAEIEQVTKIKMETLVSSVRAIRTLIEYSIEIDNASIIDGRLTITDTITATGDFNMDLDLTMEVSDSATVLLKEVSVWQPKGNEDAEALFESTELEEFLSLTSNTLVFKDVDVALFGKPDIVLARTVERFTKFIFNMDTVRDIEEILLFLNMGTPIDLTVTIAGTPYRSIKKGDQIYHVDLPVCVDFIMLLAVLFVHERFDDEEAKTIDMSYEDDSFGLSVI